MNSITGQLYSIEGVITSILFDMNIVNRARSASRALCSSYRRYGDMFDVCYLFVIVLFKHLNIKYESPVYYYLY